MWWLNCLILFMFTICLYSFKDVGALKAAKSNRSQTKIGIIERLLFEKGKVRKDYGSVKARMNNGKAADRISQWKTLGLGENAKYQPAPRIPNAETIIQLQDRKCERMANQRYRKILMIDFFDPYQVFLYQLFYVYLIMHLKP